MKVRRLGALSWERRLRGFDQNLREARSCSGSRATASGVSSIQDSHSHTDDRCMLTPRQYLPLPEIDTVANALNFSTPDCHIVGGCDLYTTKAAGTDKKLYKNIETTLESQYESLVRLSASLSPPYRTASEDGLGSEKNSGGSRKRGHTAEAPEIDLSRSSPFGPLSQITARRTFAYLIATLNASHPDYDFSHLLRPADFRKERSLRTIMHTIDSTLQHLRPRQTISNNYLSPAGYSSSAPNLGASNGVWNHNMWKPIDKEMSLRQCEKYSWTPEEDPFDGDEGSIWSMHYFFFNKDKKRVCYLYLRGFSVISHSPIQAAMSIQRPKPTPRNISSLSVGEGAGKRASFWLSNDMIQSIDTISYGDDDDDEMVVDYREDDDEVEVPYMDLDEVRCDLETGRLNSWPIAEEDEMDEYNGQWTPRGVRGVSEEIGESIELDA